VLIILLNIIAWATRTLIVRKLKGLDEFICKTILRLSVSLKLTNSDPAVTVVSPRMGTHGWPFANADPFPGADADPLYQSEHVKDLYLKIEPNYSGRYVMRPCYSNGHFVSSYDRCRFTVPVLWDKKLQTIVNNESSEIIRMFNASFNEFIPAEKAALDFYPQELRAEIDAVNEWIYPNINSMSNMPVQGNDFMTFFRWRV